MNEDQLKALLEGSIEIARLKKENAALKRENGLLRLKRDMLSDRALFDISCDDLPALLKRQAE